MVPRPGYYKVVPKRRFLGQGENLPFFTIPPDPPAVLSPALRRADTDAATNVSTPYSDDSRAVRKIHVVPGPPDACLGGGKCAEGRTGPVCGVCQANTPNPRPQTPEFKPQTPNPKPQT